ncbi:MAG TPA: KH domain-containing protein [Archangium sp.]|nr:KH domain-containing protein [Archangium sp.]
MEQLIIYLARALVDQPDQVSLRASDVDGARLYELKVAPEDVGKVIGRDGRTVGALRTLLGAAAQKQGQKVRLEIQDDRRQPPQAGSPTTATPPEGQ